MLSRSQLQRSLTEYLPQGWAGQLILLAGGLAVGVGAGLSVVVLPNPLIGFFGLAGLVVAAIMLTRPLFTLGFAIAIATLLPFGVIPVRVGLTFTFLETALLVLGVTWLLQLGSRARREGEEFVTSPFDWAILLLVGLSGFALILHWQNANTTDILHNYFKLLLAILSFFPIINLVRSQAMLDRFIRVIMLCGGLAAFVGLGLYALSRPLQQTLLIQLGRVGYPTEGRILRFDEDNQAKAQRITGTSVDPNSYAGMLVLIIALLLTQLLSPKPLLKRGLILLMLLGTVAALALTYGRGAQLGAVALAFFIAFKYRRLWLYALPVIVIGALALPSTPLWTRLQAGFALQDPSTKLHLAEFQNAFAIIGRYPWLGIGFGAAPDPDLQAGVSSIYFTIAERMGLIGLAAFILVMALFLSHVAGNFWKLRDEKQKANLLGLTMGVLGALTVGILDHYFFNIEFSHMAALFWLFIALAVVQIRLGRSPDTVTAR